jgi:hypothetical protein
MSDTMTAARTATAQEIADLAIRGIEIWVQCDHEERDYTDWDGAFAIEHYCYDDMGEWTRRLPPPTDAAVDQAELIVNDFLTNRGVVVFA